MNLTRIIKEELQKLYESITFAVDDYNYEDRPQNVFDVATLIKSNVLFNLLKKLNPFQVNRFKSESLVGNQVVPDGYDAFKTKGVINFYLTGIPPESYNYCIEETKKFLDKMNISYGDIYIDDSNSQNGKVIRIPIDIQAEDTAPEMNISSKNARTLMEYLGFNEDSYAGTIPASELLMRVSMAEKKLNTSDMQDTYGMTKPELNKNVFIGEIGKTDMLRYFSKLKDLCNFAIENGYKNISYV